MGRCQSVPLSQNSRPGTGGNSPSRPQLSKPPAVTPAKRDGAGNPISQTRSEGLVQKAYRADREKFDFDVKVKVRARELLDKWKVRAQADLDQERATVRADLDRERADIDRERAEARAEARQKRAEVRRDREKVIQVQDRFI